MKILSTIRYNDWWEYKMSTLLAIAYATSIKFGVRLSTLAPVFFYLLCALVVGAIYVSLVNDITDLKDDRACGKTNRMMHIPPTYRWILVILSLLSGTVALLFLSLDRFSTILYVLSWIIFSLYSLPPVRLKCRGIWGVMADACGAHLFPGLFIVSGISFFTRQDMNWNWFAAVGIWSMAYGLRGILWHQFYDRDKDLLAGLNTFAAGVEPHAFKKIASIILLIELLALSAMLTWISVPLTFVALGMYLLWVWARHRKLGIQIIVILSPVNKPFQIFMLDYYQAFLPLSLLVASAMTDPIVWTLCVVHLILFPRSVRAAVKDAQIALRSVI